MHLGAKRTVADPAARANSQPPVPSPQSPANGVSYLLRELFFFRTDSGTTAEAQFHVTRTGPPSARRPDHRRLPAWEAVDPR
jgi:hypothetical protein